MPRVRPDCRSVYGHVTAEFSPMGSLPHFLTHGAPLRARELRYHLYFPLFHYRLSNTVNLEGEPFMKQHFNAKGEQIADGNCPVAKSSAPRS